MCTNIHTHGRSRGVIALAAVLLLTLTAVTIMCTAHGSDDSSASVDEHQYEVLSSDKSGTTGDCYWMIRYIKDVTTGVVDKELVISGYGRMGDYWVLPPWDRDITSAVICDGVTYIGEYCFRECTKLTTLVVDNGVSECNSAAFTFCYSMSDLTIPVSFYAGWRGGPLPFPFDSLRSVTFTLGADKPATTKVT